MSEEKLYTSSEARLMVKDVDNPEETFLCISTLEGTMKVKNCDWIIKGVAGEFYPCKDEIFKATYEEEPEYGHP